MLARQGSEMQQPVLLHDRRTGNAAGHIDILIAGGGGGQPASTNSQAGTETPVGGVRLVRDPACAAAERLMDNPETNAR
jgi:hypothetical protein